MATWLEHHDLVTTMDYNEQESLDLIRVTNDAARRLLASDA